MKRMMLLLGLLVLALPAGAVIAQAAAYDIQVTGCEEPGGTYAGTITAHHDGSFWTDLHVIDENHPGTWGQCMGSVADGWTHTVTGLSEGTEFGAYFWVHPDDVRTITLNSSLPSCVSASSGAKPLFDMWVLTGGGKYCILVRDTHPSAERQKALCFPAKAGWPNRCCARAPCTTTTSGSATSMARTDCTWMTSCATTSDTRSKRKTSRLRRFPIQPSQYVSAQPGIISVGARSP